MNNKERIMEIFDTEPSKTQHMDDIAERLNLPLEEVVGHCFDLSLTGYINMTKNESNEEKT